jgi:hypothetical protein
MIILPEVPVADQPMTRTPHSKRLSEPTMVFATREILASFCLSLSPTSLAAHRRQLSQLSSVGALINLSNEFSWVTDSAASARGVVVRSPAVEVEHGVVGDHVRLQAHPGHALPQLLRLRHHAMLAEAVEQDVERARVQLEAQAWPGVESVHGLLHVARLAVGVDQQVVLVV